MSAVAQRAGTPPVLKDLCKISENPASSPVLRFTLHAWVIRRIAGLPDKAMLIELVPTGPIRRTMNEVLCPVMTSRRRLTGDLGRR